jgi:hypothetical protein
MLLSHRDVCMTEDLAGDFGWRSHFEEHSPETAPEGVPYVPKVPDRRSNDAARKVIEVKRSSRLDG